MENDKNNFKSPYDEIAEIPGDEITSNTRLTKKTMNELTKISRLIDIVIIIIGALGVIAHIVLSLLSDPPDQMLLILYIALLGVGAVLFFMQNKITKDTLKDINTYCYVFTKDSISVSAFKNETFVGATIVLYSDIKKYKFDKSFIMLYLKDNASFPVSTEELSEEEKQRITDWIKNGSSSDK